MVHDVTNHEVFGLELAHQVYRNPKNEGNFDIRDASWLEIANMNICKLKKSRLGLMKGDRKHKMVKK